VSLAVLKIISYEVSCRLEEEAERQIDAVEESDPAQTQSASLPQAATTQAVSRGIRRNESTVTDAFASRKRPHTAAEAADLQSTPSKRPTEVEVLDMTDGDSPPKRLWCTQVDPVPFSLGQDQSIQASSGPARPSDRRREKRKLELMMEEIKIEEEKLRLQRQLLELESDDET